MTTMTPHEAGFVRRGTKLVHRASVHRRHTVVTLRQAQLYGRTVKNDSFVEFAPSRN